MCRVLCIFCMIYVHVGDARLLPTFAPGGDLHEVFIFFQKFLGRASVATLSLISGYLVVQTLARKPDVANFVRSRFTVLIVPMAVWNVLAVCVVAAAMMFGFGGSSASMAVPGGLGQFLDQTFAFSGHSTTPALAFLRELFVASIILALALPLVRRMPLLALFCTLLIAVFELGAPVLNRPMILFFLVAGAVVSVRGMRLVDLGRPQIAIPVAGACLFLSLVLPMVQETSAVRAQELNLLKRVMLVFLTLFLASVLIRSRFRPALERLEPVAYLTFLSHSLVLMLIWNALKLSNAPWTNNVLAAFFFVAPVVCFAIALTLKAVIDRMPSPVPQLLTGKPTRPQTLKPAKRPVASEAASD